MARAAQIGGFVIGTGILAFAISRLTGSSNTSPGSSSPRQRGSYAQPATPVTQAPALTGQARLAAAEDAFARAQAMIAAAIPAGGAQLSAASTELTRASAELAAAERAMADAPPPAPTLADSGAGSDASADGGVHYSIDSWLDLLGKLDPGTPREFYREFLRVESGGNPCAVGNPFASFDGGTHPLESGIAQLWGPDNYKTLGVDPSAIRAYCAPKQLMIVRDRAGKPILDGAGKPKLAMGFPSIVTRPLTEDERFVQAKSMVDLIRASRNAALRELAAAGVTWPSHGPDFWQLVKLQHALPGLGNAMQYVHASLGRGPRSWDEFAAAILSPSVLALIKEHDPGTYAYAPEFAHYLENARKTGAVVQGSAVA